VDALSYLSNYSKKSDGYLRTFFEKKRSLGRKIDEAVVESLNVFEDYSLGGKKLRGALTVLGYQIAGGRDRRVILPVSCGIELLHNFLLIHDDVIDRDKKRRGKDTIHELYSRKNGDHYGISKAIVIGDIGAILGYELIINSKFPRDRIVKALSSLNDFLLRTMFGEMLDVDFDLRKKVSWEEILKVRTYKTAYYTLVMPLSVGAILGDAEKTTLKSIENYGLPVGIAFQLIDDVLGVFGDPKVTGKSDESDIKEGKKTFLYAKALELSSNKEKDFLLRWYGSKRLDKVKIERIREIIKNSGSLNFSREYAVEMVKKSIKYIPRITRNLQYQEVLSSLANFMINRRI
jgi:geranylgeranyl diphosphate synthase type I